MRRSIKTAFLFVFAAAASAAVVDRVAAVVGGTVITESEVLRELRLTAFLNGQPLGVDAASRRAAAERLVDQQLIRNEMQAGNYPQPADTEVDAMLRTFRQEHFTSPAQFHATLEKYAITEEELKDHLRWQLAAVRFTDLRFRPQVAPAGEQNSADRARSAKGGEPVANGVDQQMDAWLKEARANTKVQFKPGAFQ